MMWWRIVNFVAVFVMIYMILTLGIRISDDINSTAGASFVSIATTITIVGSNWFDTFYRRRAAAKERLLYLRALSEKIEAEAEETDLTDRINQHFYQNKPSAHGVIAKDGHFNDN